VPLLATVCLLLLLGACYTTKKPKPVARYQPLPAKKVPDVLKGTLLERADLTNTEPFVVSGYGLVANLDGTGGGQAPAKVRDYMIGQMAKNRFGSETIPELRQVTPERILRSPRFAVVEVQGHLPPGIRKGDFYDVHVLCLPDNETTSLAGGDLYQTDLRIRGADPMQPAGSVNVYSRAQGPIFVNPAYAFVRKSSDPQAQFSLRQGIVMDGGASMADRPLSLRLRQPQFSMTRRIEYLIDERFQELPSDVVSSAQDEAIVNVFVPRTGPYRGDWQHFAGVVTHLYLDRTPAFRARKAKELAEAAVQPGALLEDIALCWEGLGADALPATQQLMTHSSPEIAYAAARAAAFLGDAAAPEVLARMAQTPNHQFRIKAIQTLGAMTNSPAINQLIRPLVNAPESLVRIEAYKVLARNEDPSVFSTVIKDSQGHENFVLSLVPSTQPPIVFATRSGVPRIAIIGDRARLSAPILYMAMENRLSISAPEADKLVTIYYRGPNVTDPVSITSSPDLAEIVARLAGQGAVHGFGLDFGYTHVVAILSALTEQQKVTALADSRTVPASFVLEETPGLQAEVFSAPPIEGGRPQADRPQADPPKQDADGGGMGMVQ
jgi:hypothetical protein